jgi:hypothetical protein
LKRSPSTARRNPPDSNRDFVIAKSFPLPGSLPNDTQFNQPILTPE